MWSSLLTHIKICIHYTPLQAVSFQKSMSANEQTSDQWAETADTLQSQIRLYRFQFCLAISGQSSAQANKNVIFHYQSVMLVFKLSEGYIVFLFSCFLLVSLGWDRWIEAIAFWIFDISCFLSCSCIFSRDCSVFFRSAVVFCCGLQWFLFSACVIVQCVDFNTVSECVSSFCFCSKPWCWSRRWRHEDMPLGVNPSFCITCVFVPDRSCKKKNGAFEEPIFSLERIVYKIILKEMSLESLRRHQGCRKKRNILSLKTFEAV